MLGSEQRQWKMVDKEELRITKAKAPPPPLNLNEAIEDEVLNQKTARSESTASAPYKMCYEACKDLKLSRQSQVKCEYMRSVETKFTFSIFQDLR